MMLNQLLGPAQIFAYRGVKDAETYRAAAAEFAAKSKQALQASAVPLLAHVSEGRWVADCPNCHAGVSVLPGWPEGHCLQCFSTFADVRFPPDWPEVERLLLLRPNPINRNFRRHETTAHLVQQNMAHGVEV